MSNSANSTASAVPADVPASAVLPDGPPCKFDKDPNDSNIKVIDGKIKYAECKCDDGDAPFGLDEDYIEIEPHYTGKLIRTPSGKCFPPRYIIKDLVTTQKIDNYWINPKGLENMIKEYKKLKINIKPYIRELYPKNMFEELINLLLDGENTNNIDWKTLEKHVLKKKIDTVMKKIIKYYELTIFLGVDGAEIFKSNILNNIEDAFKYYTYTIQYFVTHNICDSYEKMKSEPLCSTLITNNKLTVTDPKREKRNVIVTLFRKPQQIIDLIQKYQTLPELKSELKSELTSLQNIKTKDDLTGLVQEKIIQNILKIDNILLTTMAKSMGFVNFNQLLDTKFLSDNEGYYQKCRPRLFGQSIHDILPMLKYNEIKTVLQRLIKFYRTYYESRVESMTCAPSLVNELMSLAFKTRDLLYVDIYNYFKEPVQGSQDKELPIFKLKYTDFKWKYNGVVQELHLSIPKADYNTKISEVVPSGAKDSDIFFCTIFESTFRDNTTAINPSYIVSVNEIILDNDNDEVKIKIQFSHNHPELLLTLLKETKFRMKFVRKHPEIVSRYPELIVNYPDILKFEKDIRKKMENLWKETRKDIDLLTEHYPKIQNLKQYFKDRDNAGNNDANAGANVGANVGVGTNANAGTNAGNNAANVGVGNNANAGVGTNANEPIADIFFMCKLLPPIPEHIEDITPKPPSDEVELGIHTTGAEHIILSLGREFDGVQGPIQITITGQKSELFDKYSDLKSPIVYEQLNIETVDGGKTIQIPINDKIVPTSISLRANYALPAAGGNMSKKYRRSRKICSSKKGKKKTNKNMRKKVNRQRKRKTQNKIKRGGKRKSKNLIKNRTLKSKKNRRTSKKIKVTKKLIK